MSSLSTRLDGRHYFVERGCGTSTYYDEISEDEYNKYKSMPPKEFHQLIESKQPVSVLCGYGYYGASLKKEDGMYFLGVKQGNSCD